MLLAMVEHMIKSISHTINQTGSIIPSEFAIIKAIKRPDIRSLLFPPHIFGQSSPQPSRNSHTFVPTESV